MPLSKDEAEHEEEMLGKLAVAASKWTDQEFAARIVGLLIEDRGLINAYQRTIEYMVKVSRYRDKILRTEGKIP